MSKRAGTFVTLSDILEAVGRDVVRFIMLTRRNDQTLEFDYQKVTEQSRDNPVFYVQYAHARCCSVLRHCAEVMPDLDASAGGLAAVDLSPLRDSGELALIRRLAGWPRLLEGAAEVHEPHRIAFYLYDLAGDFHALWTRGRDAAELRFVIADDRATTAARLALVRGVQLVVAAGLAIMGVVPVEELH
jgi:arginyl-tRNA synthetase